MNTKKELSRRGLLATLGLGMGSLAIARYLPVNEIESAMRIGAVSDVDILNFALNLEYLEAEFYTYAMTGKGLPSDLIDGVGKMGPTNGGKEVPLDDPVLTSIGIAIMHDEWNHVKFLRTALGNKAVAKPEINLNALGIGFQNETEFILLSRAFEDTGVSAYAGAAKLIKNPDYLQAAAQILASEAYHAGAIRAQLLYKTIDAKDLDATDVIPTTRSVFPTDMNGLVKIRDAGQVAIVVRGNQASGGAFYPNGMNGTIR
jgi:hypothetical protein